MRIRIKIIILVFIIVLIVVGVIVRNLLVYVEDENYVFVKSIENFCVVFLVSLFLGDVF